MHIYTILNSCILIESFVKLFNTNNSRNYIFIDRSINANNYYGISFIKCLYLNKDNKFPKQGVLMFEDFEFFIFEIDINITAKDVKEKSCLNKSISSILNTNKIDYLNNFINLSYIRSDNIYKQFVSNEYNSKKQNINLFDVRSIYKNNNLIYFCLNNRIILYNNNYNIQCIIHIWYFNTENIIDINFVNTLIDSNNYFVYFLTNRNLYYCIVNYKIEDFNYNSKLGYEYFTMGLKNINYIENLCAVCKKTTSKRCSTCKEAYYCSLSCQKEDWEDLHQYYCCGKIENENQKQNSNFHNNSFNKNIISYNNFNFYKSNNFLNVSYTKDAWNMQRQIIILCYNNSNNLELIKNGIHLSYDISIQNINIYYLCYKNIGANYSKLNLFNLFSSKNKDNLNNNNISDTITIDTISTTINSISILYDISEDFVSNYLLCIYGYILINNKEDAWIALNNLNIILEHKILYFDLIDLIIDNISFFYTEMEKESNYNNINNNNNNNDNNNAKNNTIFQKFRNTKLMSKISIKNKNIDTGQSSTRSTFINNLNNKTTDKIIVDIEACSEVFVTKCIILEEVLLKFIKLFSTISKIYYILGEFESLNYYIVYLVEKIEKYTYMFMLKESYNSYYDKATFLKNNMLLAKIYFVVAGIYIGINKLSSAIELYNQALFLITKKESDNNNINSNNSLIKNTILDKNYCYNKHDLIISINYNLSLVYYVTDQPKLSVPILHTTLKIIEEEFSTNSKSILINIKFLLDNNNIIKSMHSNNSVINEQAALIYTLLGEIGVETNNLSEALIYLNKANYTFNKMLKESFSNNNKFQSLINKNNIILEYINKRIIQFSNSNTVEYNNTTKILNNTVSHNLVVDKNLDSTNNKNKNSLINHKKMMYNNNDILFEMVNNYNNKDIITKVNNDNDFNINNKNNNLLVEKCRLNQGLSNPVKFINKSKYMNTLHSINDKTSCINYYFNNNNSNIQNSNISNKNLKSIKQNNKSITVEDFANIKLEENIQKKFIDNETNIEYIRNNKQYYNFNFKRGCVDINNINNFSSPRKLNNITNNNDLLINKHKEELQNFFLFITNLNSKQIELLNLGQHKNRSLPIVFSPDFKNELNSTQNIELSNFNLITLLRKNVLKDVDGIIEENNLNYQILYCNKIIDNIDPINKYYITNKIIKNWETSNDNNRTLLHNNLNYNKNNIVSSHTNKNIFENLNINSKFTNIKNEENTNNKYNDIGDSNNKNHESNSQDMSSNSNNSFYNIDILNKKNNKSISNDKHNNYLINESNISNQNLNFNEFYNRITDYIKKYKINTKEGLFSAVNEINLFKLTKSLTKEELNFIMNDPKVFYDFIDTNDLINYNIDIADNKKESCTNNEIISNKKVTELNKIHSKNITNKNINKKNIIDGSNEKEISLEHEDKKKKFKGKITNKINPNKFKKENDYSIIEDSNEINSDNSV